MKIICANPECARTVRTLSIKLGLPGAGEKKDNHWFCGNKCYSSYLADRCIADKRCGLTKPVLSMPAGVAPIVLPPRTKVKLKDEIPFKMIDEFHMVIFDYDLESKVILAAVYEMDYIASLLEYFSKVYPGHLVKFYLDEKEKILTILANNYPGKPLRVDAGGISPGKAAGGEDTELDKVVMKLVEFLNGFPGNDMNGVKIDNLDDAVWLKSETKEFKIDIYLTRKTRGKVLERD